MYVIKQKVDATDYYKEIAVVKTWREASILLNKDDRNKLFVWVGGKQITI